MSQGGGGGGGGAVGVGGRRPGGQGPECQRGGGSESGTYKYMISPDYSWVIKGGAKYRDSYKISACCR